MSLPQPRTLYTIEEYLAQEREATERHEYLDGEIYEMAGESIAHEDICVNLVGQLYNQLRGKSCRALTKDTKVLSGPTLKTRRSMKGVFSYPDLVAVCGTPQFLDERRDVLINPTVIIEVTSPSIEAFDRTMMFFRYRKHLPSLTDYLLVAQDWPWIDHYRRQEPSQWVLSSVEGLEATLQLTSIDCTLRLADVYDRVEFSDEWLEMDEELEADEDE